MWPGLRRHELGTSRVFHHFYQCMSGSAWLQNNLKLDILQSSEESAGNVALESASLDDSLTGKAMQIKVVASQ